MRADAFFQFSDSDAQFSPAGAKSPLKIVRWPGISHDSPGRWNKELSLYIVASVRRQLFLDTQFLLLQTCKEYRIRQRSALFRHATFIQASMLGLKSCHKAGLHIYPDRHSVVVGKSGAVQ